MGVQTSRTIPPDLAVHDYVFRPVWDTRERIVSAYMCYAKRSTVSSTDYGYSTLADRDDIEAVAELDCALLMRNIDLVAARTDDATRFLLVSPISFEAVRRCGFARYEEALATAPPAISRFLSLMVIDPPADGALFAETIAPFRRLCRSVLTYVPFGGANPARFSGVPLGGIGTSLANESRSEAQVLAELSLFAARARRLRINALLLGIQSKTIAVAAEKAGFRYMSGPYIADDIDAPGEHGPVLEFEPVVPLPALQGNPVHAMSGVHSR